MSAINRRPLAVPGILDEFPTPGELLRVVRRHVLLVLAVVLPLTAAATAYGLLTPVRYVATASLALAPRGTALPNLGEVPGQLVRDMPVLATEQRVITSPPVLGAVVDSLDLTRDPAFVSPPGLRRSVVELAEAAGPWIGIAPGSDALQLVRSLVYPPAPEMDREAAIQQLAEDLDVEQVAQSYAVAISLRSADPVLASKIVNEVARAYVQRQLESKISSAGDTSNYLKRRVDELRRQVATAEAGLATFRVSHGLPVEGSEEERATRANTLTLQLVDLRAQVAVAEAKVRSLERMIGSNDIAALEGALDSNTAQALQLQDVELQRRAADLLASYGERHPLVQSLRADQDTLRQRLKREAEATLAAARRDLELLRVKADETAREIQETQSQIGGDEHVLVEYRDLQRQADADRTLYEQLLAQQKLLDDRLSMLQPDVQVIAEASPELEPASPPLAFFPLVGFVGSAGLALLLALVRDRLDPRVRSAHQLEKVTGLPVLARLPRDRRVRRAQPWRYVSANPGSAYAETLRHIHYALEAARRPEHGLVVLVTSPSEGEGKSTTVAGLGGLLHHAGRRTVVVDLDLRRPRLARLHREAEPAATINELLTATEAQRERWIDELADRDYAIVAATPAGGAVLPLLEGRALPQTIGALKKRFDYVLLDTPPVLPSSDARFLARHADVSLLVCRWMRTDLVAVREAADLLEGDGLAVLLGVAVNMIRAGGYPKYAYSYGERPLEAGSYPRRAG